jgi:hypothetical protein
VPVDDAVAQLKDDIPIAEEAAATGPSAVPPVTTSMSPGRRARCRRRVRNPKRAGA